MPARNFASIEDEMGAGVEEILARIRAWFERTRTNVIEFLNSLTDMDWGWWPFLRLRPSRNERLTTRRVALMSLMFGPLYSGLIVAPFLFIGRGSHSGAVGLFVVVLGISCVVFFVVYRLTFAVAWNVRAEKLRTQSARE